MYPASQHFYFQVQCSVLVSTPFNWVIEFVPSKHSQQNMMVYF